MQTLTTKQLAQACGAAHATRLPTPLHVTYPRSDIETLLGPLGSHYHTQP